MPEDAASALATAIFTDSYREATEDRAAIIPLGSDGVLLVVADGVGGRAGGAAAAGLALQMVQEATPTVRLDDAQAWRRLIERIDRTIADDPEAGETTLVLAAITPKRIVGASVGDSEAWFITPEGHFDLTGGQVRKPYLGFGGASVIPFIMPIPGPGTILVATDGLFKYAPDERIGDVAGLPDLEEAARRLGDLPRLISGRLPDDIAVLLCRIPPGGNYTNFGQRLRGLLPFANLRQRRELRDANSRLDIEGE